MKQRVVLDGHDVGAVPDVEPLAQLELLAHVDAIESLADTAADRDDRDLFAVEVPKTLCHPVVLAEQVQVHQRQAGGPRVHQRRVRLVLFVGTERSQADRPGFDFLAGRMVGGTLQIGVLLVSGVRVVNHKRTGLAWHHRNVIEDVQQALSPCDGVVPLDELGRRHRPLAVLEDLEPLLADGGADKLGLLVGIDQLRTVRHPRHEARGIQVDHVDVAVVPVEVPVQAADQQPLQVQHRGRGRLAGVGAPQVHRTDVGRRVRLRRQAVSPRLGHPVVDHRKRKATGDAVDVLIELGQVDALEHHRGELWVGIGCRHDLQFGLIERLIAVERQALTARSHHDTPGGVQALREAETECMLALDGVFVPSAFVEGQQPLEVVDAAAVVDDGEALGRWVVFHDHLRCAGAPGVLQQFRNQRELVREGEAPVAQGTALVDSDLHSHEVLLERARVTLKGDSRSG